MDRIKKIQDREFVISVIGLGYVGLPLAIAFAEEGFNVFGIESDGVKVDQINRGESYVDDISSDQLSQVISDSNTSRNGSLRATKDYSPIDKSDAVLICVPTPLDKTKNPDLSFIIDATDELVQRLHKGLLIILESTTYPGTTNEVILPRLNANSDSKMVVGTDFFLAYSPERIDPGNLNWNIRNIPKIVGGITSNCNELASALYGTIVPEVVGVSSTQAAEMVKQLENTFRATNIALVNEMAIICDRLGIDVWEVIEAARTKPFGFMPFYPGPGLGGHCLPIDPQFLTWKLKTLDYNSSFLQMAEEINLGMPTYISNRLADILNEIGKPLSGSRILVLGVSYKEDTGDIRESPAVELIRILLQKGAKVSYNDPYVDMIETNDLALRSFKLDGTVLGSFDCLVITTAHTSYDWTWILEHSSLIFDTRNATDGLLEGETCKVIKL